MRASQTVRRGRRLAEQLMTSSCVIVRADGEPAPGPSGEIETPTRAIYSGPCRLRVVSSVTSGIDAAEQLLVGQDAVLSLPVATSGDVQVNDLVTITASTQDPALVGHALRVSGLHFETHGTARRLPVEMVS